MINPKYVSEVFLNPNKLSIYSNPVVPFPFYVDTASDVVVVQSGENNITFAKSFLVSLPQH